MPNYIINVKEKGAKKASKNIGGLSNALGGMASKAALAAGGLFGAGMLLSGMKNAINLAGEQELAEKKLTTALGFRSKALLDQASALQQVSTFGDEATIEAMSMMAAFTQDEDALKKLTVATLDYAAATGTDLNAASQLVGRTFGTSMNAMSRYGVAVEGAAGSSERLESLTGNLANMFGGQASAQAETMSGKMTQMKNAFGDAAEAFGELLFPLVIPLAEGLKIIGEGAVSVMNAFKSMITPETVNLLTEADLKTEEFRQKLARLSAVELMMTAQGFSELHGSMKVLTETEIDNLDALFFAIEKNAELQEALNFKITDSETRKIDTKLTYSEILNGLTKKEIKDSNDIATIILNNEKAVQKEKEKSIMQDMKGAALSGQSASNAMKSVVRAETMEAVAGYLASILKTVPFPLNIGLAAAGGGLVAGLMDKALSVVPSFATGADFVTSGPQMLMVGDNPSGMERVSVTPLGGDPNINGPQGGGQSISVSIQGNVMTDQFVEEELAEKIKEAIRRGTDFGIS